MDRICSYLEQTSFELLKKNIKYAGNIASDVFIRERKRTALVLCLFWSIVVALSFYFIEYTGTFEQDLFHGQETFWAMIAVSLLILVLGLVIFFGNIGMLFPFAFFSEKDMLQYNIEKISLLMGILMILMSYALTFATIGGIAFLILLVIAVAITVGGLYTVASKRFEAGTQ